MEIRRSSSRRALISGMEWPKTRIQKRMASRQSLVAGSTAATSSGQRSQIGGTAGFATTASQTDTRNIATTREPEDHLNVSRRILALSNLPA